MPTTNDAATINPGSAEHPDAALFTILEQIDACADAIHAAEVAADEALSRHQATNALEDRIAEAEADARVAVLGEERGRLFAELVQSTPRTAEGALATMRAVDYHYVGGDRLKDPGPDADPEPVIFVRAALALLALSSVRRSGRGAGRQSSPGEGNDPGRTRFPS
jgi:hypothetical protein